MRAAGRDPPPEVDAVRLKAAVAAMTRSRGAPALHAPRRTSAAFLEPVRLFAVVVLLFAGGVRGQPACHISRDVTLERIQNWPLISRGVLFNDTATLDATPADYTLSIDACQTTDLGFPSEGLLPCGTSGIVGLHDASGNCVASWSEFVSVAEYLQGWEKYVEMRFYNGRVTATTTQAELQASNLIVSISCDPLAPDNLLTLDTPAVAVTMAGGTPNIAALPTPVDPFAHFDTLVVNYTSRAACTVNNNVCTVPFAQRTEDSPYHRFCPGHLRCIAGVCVDSRPECIAIQQNAGDAYSQPGVNVRGSLEVTDTCRNVSVAGLPASEFEVRVDRRAIPDDREHATLISRDVGFREQVMVTIGVDLSTSLLRNPANNDTEELRASLVELVDGLFDGRMSAAPRVALFGFDGSPDLTTLLPSYTSEPSELLKHLEPSAWPWDSPDTRSTNFRGAVAELARVAGQAGNSVQGRRSVDGEAVDVTSRNFMILLSDSEDTANRVSRAASLAAARAFLAQQPGNTIFVGALLDATDTPQVQQFPVDRREYLRDITDSTYRTFFAYPSDLPDLTRELATLVTYGATTYSISMCSPLRDNQVHGMYASLRNLNASGTKGDVVWRFVGSNASSGCNETTLAAAAKARGEAEIVDTLPVLSSLSQTTFLPPPYPAYFLIDTANLRSGELQAERDTTSTSAAPLEVYVGPDNTSCAVVTKSCYATRSGPTGFARLPTATGSGGAYTMQRLMAFVDYPSNAGIADDTRVTLTANIQQQPTAVPPAGNGTGGVTDAPDTGGASDDDDVHWVIWVVVGLALCMILACLVKMYFDKKNKAQQEGSLYEEEQELYPRDGGEGGSGGRGGPPAPPGAAGTTHRPAKAYHDASVTHTTSIPSPPPSLGPGPIEEGLNHNVTRAAALGAPPPQSHAPGAGYGPPMQAVAGTPSFRGGENGGSW